MFSFLASGMIDTMKALIVVSFAHWVADDFEQATQELNYALVRDYGFDVPETLGNYEKVAWWMNAQHAARLQRVGVATELTAPGSTWLSTVPHELTKRVIRSATISEFLELGVDGSVWVKPAEAKIDGFEAAYRTSADVCNLVDTLKIPTDSDVQWTDSLLSINHECRFYVLDGEVTTGSPYLVDGITYYDGASDRELKNADAFAREAVKILGDNQPQAYTLDVGFDEKSNEWLVIEGNPAWCSGIYGADPAKVIKVIEKACYTNTQNETFLWKPDSYLWNLAQRKVPLK